MRTLCTIHLHGKLAEFGEEHQLCVSSPLDAYRAFASQLEGFAESFKEGAYRLVRGEDVDAGVEYGQEALDFPIGPAGTHFHFIPTVAGAKSGGGKVILGAVIMAAAFVGAAFTGGASLALQGAGASGWGAGLATASSASLAATIGAGLGTTAFLGVTWGGIAMFGGMLMLGGIAQMMQPGVSTSYQESAEQRASFFLGGQVNQAIQGGPVVLAYGRCRVGSTVVSAGLTSERM